MTTRLRLRRRTVVRLLHAACAAGAVALSLWLTVSLAPAMESRRAIHLILLGMFAKTTALWLVGVDRSGWRYTTLSDLLRIVGASALGSVLFMALGLLTGELPFLTALLDFFFLVSSAAALRIGVRLYHERMRKRGSAARDHVKRVLLYGAGSQALLVLKEFQSNPGAGYRVVGMVDDDRRHVGMTLMGIRVMGTGRDLGLVAEQFRRRNDPIHEVVIVTSGNSRREIIEAQANCRAACLTCRVIPGVDELLAGRVLSRCQDVTTEDLLGRRPVELSEGDIRASIEGRSVMVTGGGGSIGSELCRQLAQYRPERLVIFERSESDLFRIHLELTNQYPDLAIIPQIGDIREYERVSQVIENHGIDSIFHAAAYKHVPMMEAHVLEAVRNNVLGTWTVVEAARTHGVPRLLMISSDKAVNPTSVMGLTKRVAEILVEAASAAGPTQCLSVRFGNVLGSNGSVVPIFRQQIAAGGPVTVTHPNMRRYFMTIREAVQLVLQASIMGKQSEIFTLDMGEPVLIVDLARNMIRLSGHEPDVEIEIRFTGLRPGEKLFEELMCDGESVVPTSHEKINIFRSHSKDYRDVKNWVQRLEMLIERGDKVGVMALLATMVPEYKQPEIDLDRPQLLRAPKRRALAAG